MKNSAPNRINCYRISRVKCTDYFTYRGCVNEKECKFRIDTGSDVSLINKELARGLEQRVSMDKNILRYPTGEEVPVLFRVVVDVELGKYSKKGVSMIVADISDECILGVDFLKTINLEKIFDLTLGERNCEIVSCSRVISTSKVPDFLEELFIQNSNELSLEQKDVFAGFLRELQDVFSEEIIAGNCEVFEHAINLNDSTPIKQVPRRIPLHLRDEVNRIIEDMKMQGVIKESKSPWVSPAVIAKKKDGTLRFCVDYRKLNAVTVKDSYPLPRIQDILDQLSGNSWFTTLDLKSGYWQVKIRPEDREKTAFSIGNGLWEFTVMPFGLCNAPATFERLMEKILQEILAKICLVYLDDVIVFSNTFEDMIKNLEKVFLRFRLANLKINSKKCHFFCREVKYLGHVISEQGITTDPDKINAVKNWPIPRNKKQVRGFLGFCSYYRKFVKGFSLVAKPLFSLTEQQVKFEWTLACQEAFEILKQRLVSSPILSFPRGTMEFILDTDASNHGIGAVLSQIRALR